MRKVFPVAILDRLPVQGVPAKRMISCLMKEDIDGHTDALRAVFNESNGIRILDDPQVYKACITGMPIVLADWLASQRKWNRDTGPMTSGTELGPRRT